VARRIWCAKVLQRQPAEAELVPREQPKALRKESSSARLGKLNWSNSRPDQLGAIIGWASHVHPLDAGLCSWRSEPDRQRVDETNLGSTSDPSHIPIGPNQHRARWSDRADHRKLPRTIVSGVDRLNTI
jgi:hypothetical protein